MTETTHSPRLTVAVLSAAGTLPFIVLVIAMAMLDAPSNSTAALWLQAYTAVILGFLGGIRWGLAISKPTAAPMPLALSVCPAIAAWVMLPLAIIIMPNPKWFLGFALVFALQLVWDARSSEVPAWFKPVRFGASVVVFASLVAAWAIQAYAI